MRELLAAVGYPAVWTACETRGIRCLRGQEYRDSHGMHPGVVGSGACARHDHGSIAGSGVERLMGADLCGLCNRRIRSPLYHLRRANPSRRTDRLRTCDELGWGRFFETSLRVRCSLGDPIRAHRADS